MKLSVFLLDVGRPIAYFPKLAQACGGANAGILVAQLSYWQGRGSDQDGWIYKLAEEITEETGLSYKEQLTARKQLVSLNILSEHYDRIGHKMYFKIDFDVLNEVWDAFLQSKNKEGTLPKGISGNAPGEGGTLPKGISGNAPGEGGTLSKGSSGNAPGEGRTSIPTKSTTESTQREARAREKNSSSKIEKAWGEINHLPEAGKLAEICGIDPKWGLPKQLWDVSQNFDALMAMGMTPERLDRFLEWWYSYDWRGKKNEAPKPAQVRETWKQFEKFSEGGNQHANPNLPTRAAHNDASLKRFIERKRQRIANGQGF